jgi:hypothetical protein
VSIVVVLAGGKSLYQGHFYRQKKYRQAHKFIHYIQYLMKFFVPPLAEAGLTVWREWSIGRMKYRQLYRQDEALVRDSRGSIP